MVTQADIDAILDQATTDVNARLVKAKADIDALFVPSSLITANLQAAIDAAPPNSTLTCQGTFQEPILIAKPLTLLASGSGAVLREGLSLPGSGVTFGVGWSIFKDSARDDIIVVTGDSNTFEGTIVRGSASQGQKRGIAANGRHLTLTNCDIDDIWAVGQDSQAVCGWDNCIGLTITGGSFKAAGECILIGGADCASPDRQPGQFTLTGAILAKQPIWRTNGASCKNLLELKHCVGATIQGNTLSQCWAGGQSGYAIVLTPRNQEGGNPYATVSAVLFQNNHLDHIAAFLNLLGTDDEHPSGILTDIQVLANTIDTMDRGQWGDPWGSDKAIQLGNGGQNITIHANTFSHCQNVDSCLYLYGVPKVVGLTLTDNAFPVTQYGLVCGDGQGCGQDPTAPYWTTYVASGALSGNTQR